MFELVKIENFGTLRSIIVFLLNLEKSIHFILVVTPVMLYLEIILVKVLR